MPPRSTDRQLQRERELLFKLTRALYIRGSVKAASADCRVSVRTTWGVFNRYGINIRRILRIRQAVIISHALLRDGPIPLPISRAVRLQLERCRFEADKIIRSALATNFASWEYAVETMKLPEKAEKRRQRKQEKKEEKGLAVDWPAPTNPQILSN